MKVPYNYLPMEFRKSNKILSHWKKLIQSTDFTLGEYMIEFEKKFSKYIGAKYVISTNNGTDALILSLKSIAKKYNLKIIEDAAQGMGSYYKKVHAGSFSDVAAFSTHPLKNLNALGDGGFITTNSKKIYTKIKLYRNHGMKKRDYVESYGVNSRLDVINAEILKMRLKKLKSINDKRRSNVNIYRENLDNKYIKIPEDKKK